MVKGKIRVDNDLKKKKKYFFLFIFISSTNEMLFSELVL